MGRIAGWLFLGFGVVIAAADMLGAGRLRALGEWWFRLSPDSLQLLQPALERHVARWLWDPVTLTLLQAPAALLLGGLGAALLAGSLLARRNKRILRKGR
ncbi:MAG: hypothetical protein EA355_10400 [Rhodobacteraceae bacterium]|nr:MAG: hypothetical protein EA355_10400 [Paracoccaceae bacterium]